MTYKTALNASTKTRQLSMYNIMSKRILHKELGWMRLKVKDIDLDSLHDLLGTKTINILRLINWVNHAKPISLYERIVYKNGKWSYIGGQDYVDEMGYIKNLIRKG